MIFIYHLVDYKYEDSVLRYMDLKYVINFQHTLRHNINDAFQKEIT